MCARHGAVCPKNKTAASNYIICNIRNVLCFIIYIMGYGGVLLFSITLVMQKYTDSYSIQFIRNSDISRLYSICFIIN